MKINVHAGHNPDGKIACGAVGLIKESTEARNVVKYLISYLKQDGHTVYDCTVSNGTSQNDVLKKIVAKCNAHNADLDVSIHFNSGAGDKSGNGVTTGTEVWVYTSNSTQKERAAAICKEIAALGYRNRGVKPSTSLYVLKNTKAPALLVECCFVDDKDDVGIYNAKKMAKAIAQGIVGHAIATATTETISGGATTTKVDAAQSFNASLAGKYTVTASSGLNIRCGAGTSKTALSTIPKGKTVQCYGNYTAISGTKWLLVVYNGITGFCSSDYLKKV